MNRVGITAGASVEQVRSATLDVSQIANDIGVPLEQAVSGLESLVAAGRSLPEAMSFLPAVVATAHAAGAETSDIASTADALANSFKIAGSEMQRAFDILVEGGNVGKFELKDMARYLPSLAANAAAMGMKGEAGVRKLVSMLQVMRAQMGTSEEAATSMNNIFAKMESEETSKKFGKFGVDLRKEMAKARREGKDLIEVFLDLSNKAVKGDLSKIPQLFSDMEFARGMRALLAQRKEIGRIDNELKESTGSVSGALQRVSKDTMAELDRLSNKWQEFVREIGALTAAPGIGLMEGMLQDIRTAKGEIEDFSAWLKSTTGMSMGEIFEKGSNALGIATPAQQKAYNDQKDAERANPDLARAREAKKKSAELDEKIKLAEADHARATAAEQKSPLLKGRGEQTSRELGRLRMLKAEYELAAKVLSEPLPGAAEIPIDAAAGRASFHSFRARQARETARPVPSPEPNPMRGGTGAVTVPPAMLDDSSGAAQAGTKTGAAFRENLNKELEAAEKEAAAAAERIRNSLNFSASPTVTPRINMPAQPMSAPGGSAPPSGRQALRHAAHDTRIA